VKEIKYNIHLNNSFFGKFKRVENTEYKIKGKTIIPFIFILIVKAVKSEDKKIN
jgi:hypothetical protein